jgi:hypothetical protein
MHLTVKQNCNKGDMPARNGAMLSIGHENLSKRHSSFT